MDPEVAIDFFVVTQPGGGKTSSSPLLSPSSSVDFVEVKLPGWNVDLMDMWVTQNRGFEPVDSYGIILYSMYIGIVNILNISVRSECFSDLYSSHAGATVFPTNVYLDNQLLL